MVREYQESIGLREVYRGDSQPMGRPSAAPEISPQAPVYLPDKIRQKEIDAIKNTRAALIAADPSYAYQATQDEDGVLRDPAGNILSFNGGSSFTIVGGPTEGLPSYIKPPKQS